MTDYQKIERSRNRRLWIGQVIIPVITGAAVVAAACPQVVETIVVNAKTLKHNVTQRMKARKTNKKEKQEKTIEFVVVNNTPKRKELIERPYKKNVQVNRMTGEY